MRIGILTYYFVHNYGAILQAYGMQRVLEQLGHEVSFLTFNRNYDHMMEGADKKYDLSIKSIPFLAKYFINNGAETFYYNLIKRKKLHSFMKEHMKIGERYSDAKCDAVLIGSDEVFAIDIGVNPFLYGHNVPVENIFSYAASFGSTQLKDVDRFGCRELIQSGLTRLTKIGVRDVITAEMVKSIADRQAILNCDPVILYGYKVEIQKARKQKQSERYLILYSYDRNFIDRREIDTISSFARKNNLKVWSVGYYHKWCDKIIMCSPMEMFGLFCNSEMVITDTFHGSIVSIITNTPFMVRLNKKNQKVEYLLEQYQMENRKTDSIADLDRLYRERINYVSVNQLIEQERQKSMTFLKECLMN